MEGEGVKKVVYGLKKVSPFAVENEDGKTFRRPANFPIGDCRGCSIIEIVCVELDLPCPGVYRHCSKSDNGTACEDCRKAAECLANRPCCWDCEWLLECLENTKDEWAEGLVKSRFGCDWEEFVEAVKMLLEK